MTPVHANAEAGRRRTFAIISHPDAGKTTLTEKLLLYGGALEAAGAVKARRGRRSATSDWMEMEQTRGISITSTVLQFRYRDHVLNLLDTPGHRDFSEDTYRVLAAADAAVMVLDSAKGVEPQTLKLFEVCRARGIPLLSFLNKYDRPGLGALELLDEIERHIGLRATPVTWPVGIAGDLRGVIDRRRGDYVRYQRTARGATMAPEELVDPATAAAEEGPAWDAAAEELGILDAIGADLDLKSFLAGESTPVFFGSALTNFGVRLLLDAVVDLAPAPAPRPDVHDRDRRLDGGFSGFVFKIQANMDPSHRDRLAFVRVCSGRFERGMPVVQARTGQTHSTKYAHTVFGHERETVEEAWPGDVVGLVNAADLRIGDTLHAQDDPVEFPGIPSFAPEHFRLARTTDTARFKQFRRGVAQLDEEGVIQVLRDPDLGDQEPVLAAVGPMQFEVAQHRLEREFGAPIELRATSHTVARRTDADSAPQLARLPGVRVLERSDGSLVVLLESERWLDRIRADHPALTLEPILAE